MLVLALQHSSRARSVGFARQADAAQEYQTTHADMSHLNSYPFIYQDNETYIACKYDWSDVKEKIEHILSNYKELQPYLVENMRRAYTTQYSNQSLVEYFYKQLLTVEGIGYENN